MKHIDKLDLALQLAYENRYSNDFQFLGKLFESKNILLDANEEKIIIDRLSNDGYIDSHSSFDGSFFKINSYGIEYCEDNSYTISNSPIAMRLEVNVYNHIDIDSSRKVMDEIQIVKSKLDESADMSHTIALEIGKCLDELSEEIDQTKSIPKSKIRDLLSLSADSGTVYTIISNFIIELLK